MMRVLLFTLMFSFTSILFAADKNAEETNKPNVIFFLSDDHRADFLGCAGHPILKTPTIDRLAKLGVRFENAFVTTSICAASRATLLTGMWERSHKYTFRTPPLAEQFFMASYPAVLKKHGYHTGFIGKFGVNVGRGTQQKVFDSYNPLNRNPYHKKQADGSTRHLTEIVGDKAIEYLKQQSKEQPFCLSISFNAAHAEDGDKKNHFPWPKAEDGLYEDVTIPPPLVETDFWKQLPSFFHKSMHRDRWFWRWDTDEKYQKNVKAYYRMITGLDRVMGRVLDEVKNLGFDQNTVIIFMGDNGYYKGSRGFAGKWSHYEESLRVPLVIYDPRLDPKLSGRILQQMALNVDIPATIVDLSGSKLPNQYQGSSLVPLLKGETPQWRTDFFCEHLMDHSSIPKYEGVRDQRYVYARYFEHLPEGEFLHDLKSDPLQKKNLVNAPTRSNLLERMRKRCDELRDNYGGIYRKVLPPGRKPKKGKTK